VKDAAANDQALVVFALLWATAARRKSVRLLVELRL
jgi:hypothetical protein